MKNLPLVSIILPTFDRAVQLPRAIDSVRRQTWKHWELIVHDDGSRDNTPELLERLSCKDHRIHAFRHDNRGPGESRNLGFRNSSGSFIAFLDSDDEYLPRHLELRARFLLENPDVDFLHGGVVLTQAGLAVPDAIDTMRSIPIEECAVGGTFFARRHVLEQTCSWPDGYAEDFRLLQLVAQQFRVERVDFPTYVYHRDAADSRCNRILSDSTTHNPHS